MHSTVQLLAIKMNLNGSINSEAVEYLYFRAIFLNITYPTCTKNTNRVANAHVIEEKKTKIHVNTVK